MSGRWPALPILGALSLNDFFNPGMYAPGKPVSHQSQSPTSCKPLHHPPLRQASRLTTRLLARTELPYFNSRMALRSLTTSAWVLGRKCRAFGGRRAVLWLQQHAQAQGSSVQTRAVRLWRAWKPSRVMPPPRRTDLRSRRRNRLTGTKQSLWDTWRRVYERAPCSTHQTNTSRI